MLIVQKFIIQNVDLSKLSSDCFIRVYQVQVTVVVAWMMEQTYIAAYNYVLMS